MLSPEYIDPSTLPALPLADRGKLPTTPCVYFAIDSLGNIQYIGKSVNLKNRWLGHHRLDLLKDVGGVRIAWLEVSDPALLDDVEMAMIGHFKPRLNGMREADFLPPKPHKKRGGMKLVHTIRYEIPGLAERIQAARKASPLPLKTIAKAAGMSMVNWYRIENNEQVVPYETFRKIEAALGVDFEVNFELYVIKEEDGQE